MRMWMVNPKYMCNKHLLGEHVEIHMLIGSLLKNKSIKGFLDRGLLEPQNASTRHAELVQEMEARGMKHKSNLPELDHLDTNNYGNVDKLKSITELTSRCEDCEHNYFVYRKEGIMTPFTEYDNEILQN